MSESSNWSVVCVSSGEDNFELSETSASCNPLMMDLISHQQLMEL